VIYLVAYVVALLVYLALELIRLRALVRPLGARHLGEALRERPRLTPPLIFAFFYAAMLVYLAAGPGLFLDALEQPPLAGWIPALANGALLGLMAHGTREVSNIATLRDWRPALAAAGILWGAAASGLAAFAAWLAATLWVG
jgi:uncharacterized membrane protein